MKIIFSTGPGTPCGPATSDRSCWLSWSYPRCLALTTLYWFTAQIKSVIKNATAGAATDAHDPPNVKISSEENPTHPRHPTYMPTTTQITLQNEHPRAIREYFGTAGVGEENNDPTRYAQVTARPLGVKYFSRSPKTSRPPLPEFRLRFQAAGGNWVTRKTVRRAGCFCKRLGGLMWQAVKTRPKTLLSLKTNSPLIVFLAFPRDVTDPRPSHSRDCSPLSFSLTAAVQRAVLGISRTTALSLRFFVLGLDE